MDQIKTGGLIRALRTQKGLTQKALAEVVGVGDKAVSKWERGQGCPDVSLLPELSRVLGVGLEALLSGQLDANDQERGNMKKLNFSSPHPMDKDHYVSFVALLTGDTLFLRRLYPEWDLQTRIPAFGHGVLLWHCTRHGLFRQII